MMDTENAQSGLFRGFKISDFTFDLTFKNTVEIMSTYLRSPIAIERMWDKVNFWAELNRFKFSVFLHLDWLNNPVCFAIYP